MSGSGLRLKSGARMNHIKGALRALPVRVAEQVASQGAGALTTAAGVSYDAGRTAYDTARPAGVDGQPLSLTRTGATRAAMRFVRIGTIVRCVLGTPYAKYLIGKYAILPPGKAAIPEAWRQKLDALTRDAVAGGLQ